MVDLFAGASAFGACAVASLLILAITRLGRDGARGVAGVAARVALGAVFGFVVLGTLAGIAIATCRHSGAAACEYDLGWPVLSLPR